MNTFFCLFTIICMCLMTAILFFMIKTIEKLKDEIEGMKIKNKTFKREHNGITQVNFGNPIINRKNPYDEYKNDKGLYEPRKPSKGIKINDKEA